MSIGDRNLPYRNVTRNGAEKFSERQRDDEGEEIFPVHVRVFPDPKKVEEWSAVDGYGEQLHHRD